MFTRIFSCKTSISKDVLKRKLVGNHVKIHDLDFEIMEKDNSLRIVPHAEQIDEIKALPITYVELEEGAGETKIRITSKMRKLDAGVPMLVFIVCSLLLVASFILLALQERFFSALLFAISVISFAIFRFNLEKSYFDYVRKVKSHVLQQCQVV